MVTKPIIKPISVPRVVEVDGLTQLFKFKKGAQISGPGDNPELLHQNLCWLEVPNIRKHTSEKVRKQQLFCLDR